MHTLFPEQQQQIKLAFAQVDVAGHGFIPIGRLAALLRQLGLNPTNQQMRAVRQHAIASRHFDPTTPSAANQHAGTTGEPIIYFPDVIQLITEEFSYGGSTHGNAEIERERLSRAFRVFDREKSGLIEAADLKHALTTLGDTLSWRQAERMLQLCGQPRASDGRVEWRKVVLLLTNQPEQAGIDIVSGVELDEDEERRQEQRELELELEEMQRRELAEIERQAVNAELEEAATK